MMLMSILILMLLSRLMLKFILKHSFFFHLPYKCINSPLPQILNSAENSEKHLDAVESFFGICGGKGLI